MSAWFPVYPMASSHVANRDQTVFFASSLGLVTVERNEKKMKQNGREDR